MWSLIMLMPCMWLNWSLGCINWDGYEHMWHTCILQYLKDRIFEVTFIIFIRNCVPYHRFMNLNEVESTWIKFNQFQFAPFCWHLRCMHMWTQLYICPWYRCWVKVRFNSCSFHIIQISMKIFPSFCCLNWIELLNSRVGWSSGQVYVWNVSRLSMFEILSR